MKPVIKIDAVVTTFNPQIDRFKLVLASIINQCIKIIIVDNNSQNFENIMSICSSYHNIEIIRNDKNYGLGKALNEGIDFLKKDLDRIDYILTLDQDSIVKCNLGDIVDKFHNTYTKTNVGIININSNNKKGDEYYIINYPIISGSLVNTLVFSNDIRYRKEFFTDQIDFDFDFQVRKFGYVLFSTNTNCLSHQMGVKRGNNKFATEPMWRIYLLSRNSFVLLRERKINIIFFLSQLVGWYVKELMNNKRKFVFVTFRYMLTCLVGLIDGVMKNFTEPEKNKSIKLINSFKF